MPEAAATHNINEYSVSEIAGGIKRVVEETFGYVRVRGEVSGWRGAHTSGHAYFRLKDDKAVLEAVCWKGSLNTLGCKLEEGLEIIATGRITTYPGSSKYQIVIERAEPAGIGALMALLEKRKKMLETEGLFAPERKQLLPFMPRVIGVVTSPTGAVIRDILHRISDRFPCHVIVWPVAVQGPGAAEQIATAIDGFNAIGNKGMARSVSEHAKRGGAKEGDLYSPPLLAKPDLIIVARGGGSLEDLWAFNEEIVVRAAANSSIPLISAVGHETDTTLIDFAADVRAPTPTAAAEMAVPVREEWLETLAHQGQRLGSASRRLVNDKTQHVQLLARALPNPTRLLEQAMQRLDETAERLHGALPAWLTRRREALTLLIGAFRPRALTQEITRSHEQFLALAERKQAGWMRYLMRYFERMESFGPRLESINVQRLLERGFALVQGKDGLITSAEKLHAAGEATLRFADGSVKIRT